MHPGHHRRDAGGKKELLGFTDGARESAQDWRELLLDLQHRGLVVAPELAVADGALGFKALGELWPTTREQRCWVHKTANLLNKLPNSQQPKAKRSLQEIWMAQTSKDAAAAFDAFIAAYQPKYEGRRGFGKGSPSPARLLRFPRRTLETPADLEPDREHLCHRAAPHDPREGMPLEQDGARDGVQAGRCGAEKLA